MFLARSARRHGQFGGRRSARGGSVSDHEIGRSRRFGERWLVAFTPPQESTKPTAGQATTLEAFQPATAFFESLAREVPLFAGTPGVFTVVHGYTGPGVTP